MDLSELVAREAIRETLARYNHAGDRGRVDELAAQFAPDGVLEIKGGPTYEGREAIAHGLSAAVAGAMAAERPAGTSPPIIRHHVSSVLIHDVTDGAAEAESYFLVLGRDGPDHWGRYRDRFTIVDGRWLIAHRTVRVDAKVAGSPAPL